MKKIILTLTISILCLGLASILFSFEKPDENSLVTDLPAAETVNKENVERLPQSQGAFLTASLNPNFIPIRDWAIEEPGIQARAAAIFDPDGEKFLFKINPEERFPIASLTKIMTAIVVLENLGLDDVITVSKRAVMTEGENGRLVIGEKLSVRDLLYIMLIESSNDAATALTGAASDDFVALMNKRAEDLGLKNTHFIDPTGISRWNYSTIVDFVQLAKSSFNSNPLVWQILGIKEIDIYSQDKEIIHHLENTNKLLDEIPEIIGGKTGFTEEAGECMLTIIKKPEKAGEYLITIVLGSENRELETKKLIEWVKKAYVW